jgi:ABC-2 type transport system ATP-binding protein
VVSVLKGLRPSIQLKQVECPDRFDFAQGHPELNRRGELVEGLYSAAFWSAFVLSKYMQNIVEVKKLTKTYPRSKEQALKEISFSVIKGELFGVLGVNGAGKSTLLNILIGLVSSSGGKITIFGKNLEGSSELRGRMNIATAYADLAGSLTVFNNLMIYAKIYGVKNPKDRINALLEEFKVTHLSGQRFDQLSAGQRTRINLCKGFVNEPELLLLDEPTASLDPSTAALVRQIILRHQKERGMTVVLTSHNMREVEEMCDRVALLQGGQIFRIDTPEALIEYLKVSSMEEVFLKLANEAEENEVP